jgi:hypothetical protein
MYRRHFLLLAGIAVVFSVPLAALAGYGFFALFSDFINQATTSDTIDFNSFAPSLVALGIGTVINFAITPLLYGALAAAICQSAIGGSVTWWTAIRAALRRYFHVAGFLILLGLMSIAFCVFPLWIWISVAWSAVLPAMFVENIGLIDAMRRSWHLVQGRWWRTFFIIFLVFVLNYVVYLALGAFLYLGQSLVSIFLSPFIAVALYEGSVVLASALTHPILQIALVLIYFDLRVRKEALDLFQLAQRVSSLPAPIA